jgi:DNA-directed RNA polymerase subunit RPC12/RpoP
MIVDPVQEAIQDAEVEAWVTAEQCCPYCAHRWVAVYPIECKELECPQCGIRSIV